MKQHLTCCVCGGDAGYWEQHWNRDTGYGICPGCVAEQAVRETPETLQSFYGQPGVNYDQPMVRHFGKRYRVLAATKREGLANAFMGRTPGAAVLTVCDDGTIIIADKDDKGEPIEDMAAKPSSTADISWVDDNNGAGPQKLSNAIRCF